MSVIVIPMEKKERKTMLIIVIHKNTLLGSHHERKGVQVVLRYGCYVYDGAILGTTDLWYGVLLQSLRESVIK